MCIYSISVDRPVSDDILRFGISQDGKNLSEPFVT